MGKAFLSFSAAGCGIALNGLPLVDSRSGVVQYRNFINRCALRLDAHQTHSTRRRDTLRRDQVRSWRVTEIVGCSDRLTRGGGLQKYSARQRGTPDSMSYHELMKA